MPFIWWTVSSAAVTFLCTFTRWSEPRATWPSSASNGFSPSPTAGRDGSVLLWYQSLGTLAGLWGHENRPIPFPMRLNSQTGTECPPVSSLNCDRPLHSDLKAPELVMDAGCRDNRWTASFCTRPPGCSPHLFCGVLKILDCHVTSHLLAVTSITTYISDGPETENNFTHVLLLAKLTYFVSRIMSRLLYAADAAQTKAHYFFFAKKLRAFGISGPWISSHLAACLFRHCRRSGWLEDRSIDVQNCSVWAVMGLFGSFCWYLGRTAWDLDGGKLLAQHDSNNRL